MEWIDALPYGLIACRLDGEQFTVTGITDRALRIRTDRPLQPQTITLFFLRPREAEWNTLTPAQWRCASISETSIGYSLVFEIDDPPFRKEIFRALNEYAEYIRLKTECGDEALACSLTGCPESSGVSPTLAAQKQLWFGGPDGYTVDAPYTLALSLDQSEAFRRFLNLPFDAFQQDFFRRNRLENHPLFHKPAERVYIGSLCCFALMPDNLPALLENCASQGLKATVVLPPVRESRRKDLENTLSLIQDSAADEICVNDWGTLTLTRGMKQSVLLGQQLNRRRKDARIPWKYGYENGKALLAENCLNDSAFASRLKEYRVSRIEYESCIYPVRIAAEKGSLHLPFFQTNTSHACPLAAACEGRDPGLPRDDRACSRPCETRALLYPDNTGIVGRYNSLFGADRKILADKALLTQWLDQGIDRIVAECL